MTRKTWTEKDVLKILEIIQQVNIDSLDRQVTTSNTENSFASVGDLVQDPGPGPQEIIENKDRLSLLNEIVSKLGPKDQRIIKLRYGLEDGKYRTLDEVGAMYGATRERIRQIEMKALKKLRWLIKCKYKLKRSDL